MQLNFIIYGGMQLDRKKEKRAWKKEVMRNDNFTLERDNLEKKASEMGQFLRFLPEIYSFGKS